MKSINGSLLIVLFLLTLSTTLLSGFGPATLNCEKIVSGSADCRLTKSVALGFIDIQTTPINNLTKTELDTRLEEIPAEKAVVGPDGRTTSRKTSKEVSVYGVRLIASPSTLFNGHSFSLGPQQRNVEKINNFLASNAMQLKIRETPHGHNAFALGALGLAIFILFRTRG